VVIIFRWQDLLKNQRVGPQPPSANQDEVHNASLRPLEIFSTRQSGASCRKTEAFL